MFKIFHYKSRSIRPNAKIFKQNKISFEIYIKTVITKIFVEGIVLGRNSEAQTAPSPSIMTSVD